MAQHNALGDAGEDIASNYLKQNNYSILERNYRYKHFEIDIIALQNNTLIVVEVKTRQTNYFGEPETFLTKAQQKRLITATDFYLTENNLEYDVQFDVIAIIKTDKKHTINHIENAFYPF